MDRIQQLVENGIVQKAQDLAYLIFNSKENTGGKQFRNMNAKIFSIGDVKILQSYDTIVAMVDNNKIGYDFMRNTLFKKVDKREPWNYEWTNYSPTTAKQISAFFKENARIKYTYREV